MTKICTLGSLTSLLYLLHLVSCESIDSDSKDLSSFLRGQQNHRKLQRPDHPCVLVRVEIDLEDDIEDEDHGFFPDGYGKKDADEIHCELVGDDIEKADGEYFVPIVGIETSAFDGIESGVSTLVADGAVFFDGALQIPQDASIEFGTIDDHVDNSDQGSILRWRKHRSRQRNRRLGQIDPIVGEKKVLVIRGSDTHGASVTKSAAIVSDKIFGTAGDSVTLVSQYKNCSHNKLIFEPYDDETGVIDVQITQKIQGSNKITIQNHLLMAADAKLGGSLIDLADHVIICMPKGTQTNWIAYAYVNSWLSVYNDEWCQMLSTQVHEVGHNLGLSHSGVYGNDYGDKSGMMGYSYKKDDGPLQCFNPAKNYQLGWYQDSVVDWDPLSQGTWFGNIIGVVDYLENPNETIVVRINRPWFYGEKDLYIGYNRAKGANSEVVHDANEVVIIEGDVKNYATSYNIASLSPRTIPTPTPKKVFYNWGNGGRNLVIDFSGYGDDYLEEAFVAIYFDDCVYPDCCEGEMCQKLIKPSTESPTDEPTKAPTKAPTEQPIEALTIAPTKAPTETPTETPTKNPTKEPSSSLSTVPTKAPTKTPTETPTKNPTKEPSSSLSTVQILEQPTPIFFEILPTPLIKFGEYIEIYNSHSAPIRLQDYQICIKSGLRGQSNCLQLIDFTLNPREYFMLCKNKNSIGQSRTCHQQEEGLLIRKRKKQVITIKRVSNNERVDKIVLPALQYFEDFDLDGLVYARKTTRLVASCGGVCFYWTSPASAMIQPEDETISKRGIDMP